MQLSEQQQQVRDILKNKESDDDDHIKKITDCLNVIINNYADENDRIYFSKYGRLLVIQEMDMKAMNDDGAYSSNYHIAAGVICGLSPSHSKYIKRVHVILDSFESTRRIDPQIVVMSHRIYCNQLFRLRHISFFFLKSVYAGAESAKLIHL